MHRHHDHMSIGNGTPAIIMLDVYSNISKPRTHAYGQHREEPATADSRAVPAGYAQVMPPTHHPHTYTLPGTSTRSLQTPRLPQASSRARAQTRHFNILGERLHWQHTTLQAASTTTEERIHMSVPHMLLQQRQPHHGSIHDRDSPSSSISANPRSPS